MEDSCYHLFTLKESDPHDKIRKTIDNYIWSYTLKVDTLHLLDGEAINRCLYFAELIKDDRLITAAAFEEGLLMLVREGVTIYPSLLSLKSYLKTVPSDIALRQEIIDRTSRFLAQFEAKAVKHTDWHQFHHDFLNRYPKFLVNLGASASELTDRQVMVCELYAAGYQAGEIQRMLNICAKTLENYRRIIRIKFGLKGKHVLEAKLIELLLESK